MKIQLFLIAALMGLIIPAICFSNQKTNTTETNVGVELVITPYSTTIFSDGHGKSTIIVRVVDKSGDDITTTEAPLQIFVKGNGSIYTFGSNLFI